MHEASTLAMMELELHWILLIILLACMQRCSASLISSSEIQSCSRTSIHSEPMFPGGESCSKKFVVSLAVQSGQVSYTYIAAGRKS